MFFHIFRYRTLAMLRDISTLFWLAVFPILLGTLFYIAFSDLYDKETRREPIATAVVEVGENENFSQTLDAAAEGDEALLDIRRTDEQQALKMLEENEVCGIIYIDREPSLTIRQNGTEQTIVKYFLDLYRQNERIIIETAAADPAKLEAVLAAMSEQTSSVEELSFTEGNRDPYVQYFYNLLAMVCLFASLSGVSVVLKNEGNLSAVGARTCTSAAGKLTSIVASLLAVTVISFGCGVLAILYLVYVLKISFGVQVHMLFAVTAVGTLCGVALGFFVGSLTRASEGMKIGIAVSASLFLCFMSGLMVGNMYGFVQKYAPWFNHINPAALITDSFYTLNIYGGGERLTINLITLAAITAALTMAGFFMTRRRRYASI